MAYHVYHNKRTRANAYTTTLSFTTPPTHLLVCYPAAFEADAASHTNDRNHKHREHVQHCQPISRVKWRCVRAQVFVCQHNNNRHKQTTTTKKERQRACAQHTATHQHQHTNNTNLPAHQLAAPLCQVGVNEKVCPRAVVALFVDTVK